MAQHRGHERVKHATHDDGHADERARVRGGGLVEAHLVLPRRGDGDCSRTATARFAMRNRSVSKICEGQMTSQQPHSMQSCKPTCVQRREVAADRGNEQILRQEPRRAGHRAVSAANARPLVHVRSDLVGESRDDAVRRLGDWRLVVGQRVAHHAAARDEPRDAFVVAAAMRDQLGDRCADRRLEFCGFLTSPPVTVTTRATSGSRSVQQALDGEAVPTFWHT